MNKAFELLQCVKAHPAVIANFDESLRKNADSDRGLVIASNPEHTEVMWRNCHTQEVPTAWLIPSKLT